MGFRFIQTSSRPGMAGRERPPAEALVLLLGGRGALILGEALLLALAVILVGARLPWWPLLALMALHLALLAWGFGLRRLGLTFPEAALQLGTDAALLGGLVYFTGGYANPFISLLLVPLILGAVVLPPRLAWALAAWVGLMYTLLMGYYQPLALQVSPEAAVHLHLQGMWVNFLLTAVLVAAFTGALAAALRRRDRDLARAREQRLRDEQLFSLGLQAAAAAHDLATPLASVRLTLDDLRQDFAGDEDLSPPLELMAGQLQRVEAVLARLGRAARSRENVAGPAMPARQWLGRALERWGLLHPHASVAMDVDAELPAVEDDPVLEAVLMTLLNNAEEASPGSVAVAARVEGGYLRVEVADAGTGLGGKPAGWGVGLELAKAALARLGGRLELLDRGEGGVLARADLPLAGTGP
ncbi:MAG: sensor histidine kinase [Thiobacillus sp.]|nr:sensor histidine kinase [Thiobacillus sp.]